MTLQDMCNHKEDYNDDDDDDDSDWEPFQKHVTGIQWFCTNCTMVNLDDVLYCDVCGENKDSDNLSYGSFVSRLAQEVGQTRVKSNVVNGFEGSCTRKSTLGSCTVIGFDERMLLHSEVEMKLNPHPERPDRLRAIAASLSAAGIFPGRCIPIPAREITEEELQMVHSVEHIQAVEFTSCMVSSYFTPDTYANEHSACAARLAAGLCADLSSAIMSGQAKNGFALVRPPGHHAGVKEAMGFCLHNNAAVAALAAQGVGAKKVLIVDWDVHHGNGTQEIFEGSKSVLYVSLHRHEEGRFYPGTGAADEVGIKGAEGYCVNVPWNCGGVGDNDYIFAFQHIVLPIALAFSPDLTIVSAGFDAARGDPLGCCDVTPAGYALMTHMLMSISSGKLLVILEGGYNLRSISTSATAVIKVLLGESPGCEVDGVSPSKSGLQTVLDVLRIQRKFWPNLESNLGILQAQQVSLSFKKINHDGQTIGPPHLTQSGRVSDLSPLSFSKFVGQEDQVRIDHNEQMPKPSYLSEPQNPKRSTSCIFGKADVVKGCKKRNKLMVWKKGKTKTLCSLIDLETKVMEEAQIHGSVEPTSFVEVVSSSNDVGSSRSLSFSTSEDADIVDSITLKINPENGYPLDDATERVRALGIPEPLTAEWCDYPLSVFSDNVGNSIYYGALYSSELRLPLRALHQNFLRASGLCVAQIHPNVWRVLNRIDLLNRQLNQAVGVDEIFFCYTLMGVKCGDAQEVAAYTFRHRPGRPEIIIDYDGNKNWSNWARYPMRLIGNWEFDHVNEQPVEVPHQWAAISARIRPLYPKEIMRVQQTLTSFSMATRNGRLNSLDVVLDREAVLAPLFEAQIPIVLHIPPFEDQVPMVDMDAIPFGLNADSHSARSSPDHNGLSDSGSFVGSSPVKSGEVLVLKQKNVVTSIEDDVAPIVAVMTEAIAPNCGIPEFSPPTHCISSQGKNKTRVSKRARVSRSSSCSREMNNSPPIGPLPSVVISVNIGDGDANPIVEEQPGSSAAVGDGKGKHVWRDAYQTDVLDVGTNNANVWSSSDAESRRHLSDLMDNRVGIPCAPHDLPSYKKYDMAVRMNSPRSYHLLKAMPLDDIKMEGFNSMQRALSVLDTLQSRAEYFKDLANRRLAKLNAANKRRSEAQVESVRVTRESNTQGIRITELEATLARVMSESNARGLRITQLEADLVDVSRKLELQSRELERRELERVAEVKRLEEEKATALRDIEQNFSTQYDDLVAESLRLQELQYNKGYEAGLDEDDDEDV